MNLLLPAGYHFQAEQTCLVRLEDYWYLGDLSGLTLGRWIPARPMRLIGHLAGLPYLQSIPLVRSNMAILCEAM
jgi:hypothetical protein